MNNLANTKIILASQSPRRRELLTQAGFDFEILTSNIEEKITKTQPDEVVKELSYQKAEDVLKSILKHLPADISNDDLSLMVIGADTVVSVDGKILGKPKDKDEAFTMIKSIQNNTHQVYTGVTIFLYDFLNQKQSVTSFSECTNVTLYPMSNSEIHDYIATGDCYDKAGAYGIQGKFAIHVKGIDGDYNNVVGLPIARLYQELKQLL